MRHEIKEVTQKKVWEAVNLKRDPQSFLQSWAWGEVNRDLGDKVVRLGVYTDGKLTGLMQLIKQGAKRGPHYVLPAGPIIDWTNSALVEFTMQQLTAFAKQERVWFVRMRPEAEDTPALRSVFKDNGLISAPMHLHGENTLVLDITQSDDQLLAGMRKNTRYAVRRSLKEGYTFRVSASPNDIKQLVALQDATAKRAGFVPFPASVFEAEASHFVQADKSFLAACESDQTLAVALVVLYGDKAYYHFSGSADSARQANANYFLQWHIIQEARRRGARTYDFWGIAPEGKTKHRFAGVTTFKKGFGGTPVNWLHAHDLVVSPLYWATHTFELLRKHARGL